MSNSNKFPTMNKVVNFDEQQKQKQQMELQKASFVANTRLRMAETFLNTLIGRPDVDLTVQGQGELLVDVSVDFANTLMAKLGIVTPPTNIE